MSQVIAGETITIRMDGKQIRVKVEDASKSEAISGKVEASDAAHYKIGQVYEFPRSMLG